MDKNQLMMQVLVLALANLPTMTIVAIGILYNNSRMTDLRAFITDFIKATSERHDANLIRVEQVMDARLTRIEDHLGIRH